MAGSKGNTNIHTNTNSYMGIDNSSEGINHNSSNSYNGASYKSSMVEVVQQ